MVQIGRFGGRILRPLETGLSLMKNLLKLLTKSVLLPLRLTAAASVADVGIGFTRNTLKMVDQKIFIIHCKI